MVGLGAEEEGRPPALETLETVPFFGPVGLQVEQEDDLFNWVLVGLDVVSYLEPSLDKRMDV